MSSSRAELISKVQGGGRELSTATVMLHTAIAEASGLSAVESKTCEYLARLGPLSPKELTTLCGLAPASVTALLDRLETKGRVRRVRDPRDGRRLTIELDPSHTAAVAPLYTGIAAATARLCERFDDEQLRTITEFLDGAVTATQQAAAEVTNLAEGDDGGARR
ncbi:MarR family transcriptional regulator [Amycolatopsis antarctica]|uniref:MarR family transcriptional regulator n=1 Tax=Amycolatopsis antarctica TaxID=1854586 RepID=A0A263D578_9PSEU|nr:crosslink repair DNA glycosylase YcaQ family protein [Amycolatopsis antarctica]OZM72757.1 MarR family transcriptional regulator [Amycolatopsis antarctica]